MAGPPPPPPGPEAPRYQEWILDTIDSLRSRKARPDLERICRMVRRRHGPEPERTRAELEKLIQQRAVLRVSYKGSISYRNAARVQPPRRPPPPPPPPRRPPAAPSRPSASATPPATSAPPRSGTEASAREEEEEDEDEEEDGTGSEASEDGGAPRQLDAQGLLAGGERLPPPGPLKRGAFGQPDRAVSPALAGAEPSVPLSPGRPGPQAANGAPFSCTAGKKEKASDPVEWSVRDVVDYFTEAGFPEQATAFQEQEIDGKSLLLMQRADVLTGLSIRLGPALKIYEYHVKLLQRSHFQEEEPPPEPFPA
ncbi:LOW QUALITY PROTEIN: sterile alpha motif domain-containing protein 1-like [Ciconia boyciana]|uniref:LOW QUALITY PROTEIN: sterile alpha motif domain-containing protein 1-like n=1 Tax=Ciconia boyciana TaxID=52775 RepID=UPI003BA2D30A